MCAPRVRGRVEEIDLTDFLSHVAVIASARGCFALIGSWAQSAVAGSLSLID